MPGSGAALTPGCRVRKPRRVESAKRREDIRYRETTKNNTARIKYYYDRLDYRERKKKQHDVFPSFFIFFFYIG